MQNQKNEKNYEFKFDANMHFWFNILLDFF